MFPEFLFPNWAKVAPPCLNCIKAFEFWLSLVLEALRLKIVAWLVFALWISNVVLGIVPTPNLAPVALLCKKFNSELAPNTPLSLNCICLLLPAGSVVPPPEVAVAVGKDSSAYLTVLKGASNCPEPV